MTGKRESCAGLEELINRRFASASSREEGRWSVWPSTAEEVSALFRAAGEFDCSVRFSSGPEGGAARGGCDGKPLIRVGLERMTSIRSLDEKSLTVDVQPGIGVRALDIYLGDSGYTTGFLPLPGFDPPLIDFVRRPDWSESSILYGRVDQCFVGAEGVLPGGGVFRIKPAPARAVGPDLLGLLVAGHGSLCAVTSLWVRFWRQPKSRKVVAASFPDEVEALRCALQVAVSGVRLAAGRIYAPAWAEQEGAGQAAAAAAVAVFVLEGEQALVDAWAPGAARAVEQCHGRLLEPQHHLATKFIRIPPGVASQAARTVTASCPWAAAARLHRETAARLGGELLATRASCFFHEGCQLAWTVREGAAADALRAAAEGARRLGGALVGGGGADDAGGKAGTDPADAMRKRLEELKARLDAHGILEAPA